MRVDLDFVAAHVAALDPLGADGAPDFPYVYCDVDGTWWRVNGPSGVRVAGGDPEMAGAYRREDFIAAVTAGRAPASCGGWRRSGSMMRVDEWRLPVLGLTGSLGKWRRSTHKVTDLLDRCPPEGPRRTVGDLLGHKVIKPLDALTTVNTGLLRRLLELCPVPSVSFVRFVPTRPVVLDAGSWRAALAPIRSDDTDEFERMLLELTPPHRTPFSARNAKAQRAAALAVVAGRDGPRSG